MRRSIPMVDLEYHSFQRNAYGLQLPNASEVAFEISNDSYLCISLFLDLSPVDRWNRFFSMNDDDFENDLSSSISRRHSPIDFHFPMKLDVFLLYQ